MMTKRDDVETVGALLKRLRTATGRTQEELATDLSLRRGYPLEQGALSRWETEERLPDPVSRQLLADEFDVPVEMLRRAVIAARRLRRQRKTMAQEQELDVDRRQFITSSAGAGIAAVAPPTPYLSAGRRLGSDVPGELLRRTARLRRLDDFVGGGDTYRLYVAELAATTALADQGVYADETGRGLRAVIAEQAQLAGWAAYDAGRFDHARNHYMTALAAARAAEDNALAGNSLAFLAYLEWSEGGPDGIKLATAACETPGHSTTPAVRALLADRLAWQHAASGNHRETDRALNIAEEAIHQKPDGEPEPDWVYWVDADEIAIMTGRCWAELRRPLRAIPALEKVLGRYSDTHARDKALYLSWLASAYLDAGEVEHAAAITGRVLDLSTGLASTRPADRAKLMIQRLRPHRAIAPVGQLLERAGQ